MGEPLFDGSTLEHSPDYGKCMLQANETQSPLGGRSGVMARARSGELHQRRKADLKPFLAQNRLSIVTMCCGFRPVKGPCVDYGVRHRAVKQKEETGQGKWIYGSRSQSRKETLQFSVSRCARCRRCQSETEGRRRSESSNRLQDAVPRPQTVQPTQRQVPFIVAVKKLRNGGCSRLCPTKHLT